MADQAFDRGRALERRLIAVRWFGVAFALFQTQQSSVTDPRPPDYVVWWSYGAALALALGNIAISLAAARASGEKSLSRIGLSAFTLDTLVTSAIAWIYSYDPHSTTWVVLYVLPLEGAMRYQLSGALGVVAFTLASEIGRQVYQAAITTEITFIVSSVTFRVGVQAIVALVAGLMARGLEGERRRAEERATEIEAMAGRESHARSELQAFHDVILAGMSGGSFDETMKQIVESMARALGYESLAIGLLVEHEGTQVTRCVGAFGYPLETVGQLLPADDGIVGRAMRTGEPQLVHDVGGDPDYIEWIPGVRSEMVVPIRAGDRIIGAVDVESQISERFSADDLDRLHRLAPQVGLVISTANLLEQERRAVERLRELDAMKSDFIAITSHELRTPLTAITGAIKTLRRPQLSLPPERTAEFLEILDRQSTRLSRLVEDLLALSRLEAGEAQVAYTPVPIASVIDGAVEMVGSGADRIRVSVDPTLPSVTTDGPRLEQVVRNLLENALKFSGPDDHVGVRATRDGELLVLEVSDQGPGIPADELPRIFDRFYQVGRPMKRVGGGVGLGLYIARRLVEALGGSIEVHSSVGAGTTFRISIPFRPASQLRAKTWIKPG